MLAAAVALLVAVACKPKAPAAPAHAGGQSSKAQPAAQRRPDDGTPNILLISIDALRADRLSCYGAERPTSPNLDAFAAEAARFTHAHANAPWTLPSHASMLTGEEVGVHGVERGAMTLTPNAITVATTLHAHGYATAGVVTAPYLQSSWGFDHGFDSYDDGLAAPDNQTSQHLKTAELAVNRALAAIRARRDKPWFVFLHLFDVHHDYLPPAPYNKLFLDPSYHGHFDLTNWDGNIAFHTGMNPDDFEYVRGQYDGGVAWVDNQLGRLFAGLKEDDEWTRTVVIVTADHGDEFLEHGSKGHGHSLFNELLHVPLIVKAPGPPSPATVDVPVSLVDVLPSIAAWAGAKLADYRGSGRSFLPLLGHPAGDGADRSLFAETHLSRQTPETPRGFETMIERGGWKYIERRDAPERILLFHVAVDPGERNDLLAKEPAKVDELRALLVAHLRENKALHEELKMSRAQPIDEKTAEQLKQLGYVNN
jgi:arylsulfatase A-like enzyme